MFSFPFLPPKPPMCSSLLSYSITAFLEILLFGNLMGSRDSRHCPVHLSHLHGGHFRGYLPTIAIRFLHLSS